MLFLLALDAVNETHSLFSFPASVGEELPSWRMGVPNGETVSLVVSVGLHLRVVDRVELHAVATVHEAMKHLLTYRVVMSHGLWNGGIGPLLLLARLRSLTGLLVNRY